MKKYLSVSFIFLLFASCTKDVTDNHDTVKPEIKVVYPTDNPVIPAGFPLCMQVLISDNISLSKVWLQVNDGAGFKKEYDIPGRIMSVTEKYTPFNPGSGAQLVAKFFAIDEGGNLSSEEIKFRVNN